MHDSVEAEKLAPDLAIGCLHFPREGSGAPQRAGATGTERKQSPPPSSIAKVANELAWIAVPSKLGNERY
jgi:hypothetical protein